LTCLSGEGVWLIFLLLPEEGVQYSLVFIKRFLERSEVVWF
jgi:hypothetical protein